MQRSCSLPNRRRFVAALLSLSRCSARFSNRRVLSQRTGKACELSRLLQRSVFKSSRFRSSVPKRLANRRRFVAALRFPTVALYCSAPKRRVNRRAFVAALKKACKPPPFCCSSQIPNRRALLQRTEKACEPSRFCCSAEKRLANRRRFVAALSLRTVALLLQRTEKACLLSRFFLQRFDFEPSRVCCSESTKPCELSRFCCISQQQLANRRAFFPALGK